MNKRNRIAWNIGFHTSEKIIISIIIIIGVYLIVSYLSLFEINLIKVSIVYLIIIGYLFSQKYKKVELDSDRIFIIEKLFVKSNKHL